MDYYNELMNIITEKTDLEYQINLLNWELRITGAKKSKNYIIDNISRLEDKYYSLVTSDKYGDLLLKFIDSKDLKDLESKTICNLYEEYKKNKCIPKDFYINYNKNILLATDVWEKAKKENNYELFKPYLKKNIEMTKEYYSYINNKDNLYDTMLNEYEKGINMCMLDSLFSDLKDFLISFIKKIKSNSKDLKIEYSNEEIKTVSLYLLDYIGFDLDRGNIGIYPHGFTTRINEQDIRIAIDNSSNPLNFVKTIIHEGGHGIFEQNIDKSIAKYSNNCLSGINALHESQSRFYENILSRNKNFWIPIYDDVKKILKLDIDIDSFIDKYNIVTPSLIRTEADEVTYALHIIIRYEIEKEIFNNNLSVDDIPNMWNKKMQEYLGCVPLNDKEGLMQDIHWAECAFGYFPTYLLGNIYDGMLVELMEKELGSIDVLLKNKDIKKITKFLNDKIHKNGNNYAFNEIIGKNLTVEPLIRLYSNRYNK